MMSWKDVAVIPGKAVDAKTGLLVSDDSCAVNWEPIRLEAGSSVAPRAGFSCKLWAYTDGFDESLARTYSYDAESNWTTLLPDALPNGWGTARITVPDACYLRIGIRRADGTAAGVRALGEAVDIRLTSAPEQPIAEHFQVEANRVCAAVEARRDADDLVLLLLSDIHYSTGCIWPETARNIHAVAQRINPQAIVQLGDVTDGIAPAMVTVSFAERVLGDLAACGVPVLGCIGNHDANYFEGNAQRLSDNACARLYLDRPDPWYFEDFPEQRVRCLFLHSFNPDARERYGFELLEVFWAQRVLQQTPQGWKVLVFSHVTPTAEVHYWSETIGNGELLLKMLTRFDRRRKGAVLGFIHGHGHVDQVHRRPEIPFPIISIGCAKFEDFEECKPEGSFTPKREQGTATQDLWDVLVVKPDANRLEFVRFGAGADRSVEKHG